MGRCMYNLFPYVVVNMFLILLASADDIGRICPKTDDPDLCTRLLRSVPRSQSADLRELAQITINLAGNNATVTKIKIQSLLLSEKDPRVRACLGACDENYGNAINFLDAAVDHLKSGDNGGLRLDGGSVYEEANACEEAFKSKPPSPLTSENRVLECFGEIISVIAGLFS